MTITIASAATGINAAQQHLSKVAKESMTPEPKAEKQPNHIAKLKKRHAKVAARAAKGGPAVKRSPKANEDVGLVGWRGIRD